MRCTIALPSLALLTTFLLPEAPAEQAKTGQARLAEKGRQALVYTRGDFDAEEAARRQETAAALKVDAKWEVEVKPGVKMASRLIPDGEFLIHGNVFEWCRDWYDAEYFLLIDEDDPYLDRVAKPTYKTVRGGAAGSDFWYCRSAEREANNPNLGHPDVGLRVLLEIDF